MIYMQDRSGRAYSTRHSIAPLYIRYFEYENAYYVCRDAGLACHKISGPWADQATAQLSLEVQS